MKFLFVYKSTESKQQQYQEIVQTFLNLDIASTYFLFDLIQERLPRRAKLIFAGEDYQGKKRNRLGSYAKFINTQIIGKVNPSRKDKNYIRLIKAYFNNSKPYF